MNMRKTRRSQYQSQHQSLKKLQINPNDLCESDLYNKQAQSTKQNLKNSILNKLLLQPPSIAQQNSQKKLILNGEKKKYEPKFQKPDVQNLIQENISLKNIIKSNNTAISGLKVKNIELEKKIKLLEEGLDKFQKRVFWENQNITNKKNDEQLKQNNTCKQGLQKNISKGTHQTQFIKTGAVYTEILKKKIADLTAANMNAEKELKDLKKLPHVTIFEQNNIEKEHLMAELIRLKSIISSLSQLGEQTSTERQAFPIQLMRLMREQNQKLKGTIRLLQNDKILLKSRQTIQNKFNFDIKREVQQLRTKLLYKQSQLQKLNNENKNLLFKKTVQFRQQQQNKQSELVFQLTTRVQEIQQKLLNLQQANSQLTEENNLLKEKEKTLAHQLSQLQDKNDITIKQLNEDIEQLQFELANAKSDYLSLLNSGYKKKSLRISKNSSIAQNARSDSAFILSQQYSNQCTDNNLTKLKKKKSFKNDKLANYQRPVKWEDIILPMTHLFVVLESKASVDLERTIRRAGYQDKIKCSDLIAILTNEPFLIQRKQTTKLARYICEDQSMTGQNGRILYNESLPVEISIAVTILSSSLSKIKQKLSEEYELRWKRIFQKGRKIIEIIEEELYDKSFVRKDELIQLVQRSSREKVSSEEYEYLVLKCFDRDHSRDEFVVDVRLLRQWIKRLTRISVSSI